LNIGLIKKFIDQSKFTDIFFRKNNSLKGFLNYEYEPFWLQILNNAKNKKKLSEETFSVINIIINLLKIDSSERSIN
jgi:hypothetical protein